MDDELEPIDLEPIDLEPSEDESRFERDATTRRPRWLWVGLVAVGLATWGVIALTTRSDDSRSASTPTSAVPATTSPSFVPHADRVIVPPAVLRARLQDVGVGHFAAVIGDRLYILDENRARETLVRLPEGEVTIDHQNGQLVLASTFQQTLVSTQPIATRTLSARDFAIPAWAPQRWWILNSDGTIRPDVGGSRRRVPDGLRVAAAVEDGFVALDVANSRWVLWAGATQQTVAPGDYQLLVTGPQMIVFKSGCGYNGCSVEILDLAHGTTAKIVLTRIPNFAALSLDGKRLALSSTRGDVYIIDPASGNLLAHTYTLESSSPALAFTWTPDSRALLVVQNGAVEIRRATDGLPTSIIERTDGLQQLFALP